MTETKKKTATKREATQKSKTFKNDTLVSCKSVRFNDLVYVSPISGMRYEWKGYNDVRELPYQEIVSMRASHSLFLYAPWIIIDDVDLIKKPDFKRDFGEIYAMFDKFDNPVKFFNQPVKDISTFLDKAPVGLKDLIMASAGKYIEDGVLDSIAVVNKIDEILGTQLKMFL